MLGWQEFNITREWQAIPLWRKLLALLMLPVLLLAFIAVMIPGMVMIGLIHGVLFLFGIPRFVRLALQTSPRTTDRARRVLDLAAAFARKSASPAVGPEHLLWAAAAEGNGVASLALREFGANDTTIRACLERLSETPASERPAETLDQLLLLAQAELATLGHNYIGTEHLLLALTRATSPRLHAAFANLGLHPDRIRHEVYAILGHEA